MARTPDEHFVAGDLRDKFGRRQFVLRELHAALDPTDVQHSGSVFDADGREQIIFNGERGAKGDTGDPGAIGPAGSGAPGVDAYAWCADNIGDPLTITDWSGDVWNPMIADGIHKILLRELAYPYISELTLNGQSRHVTFEGAQGRGWYTGSALERLGTRMIYQGGASPTVTRNDGAMGAGSATLTSASGPFTNGGGVSNVYHVGQPITVTGAGPGGSDLQTQIIARTSNTEVTLADVAATAVAGATFTFTEWRRAINGLGSSGLTFSQLRLTYDNPAFDGILLDLRSDAATWSARAKLLDCVVGSDHADFSNAATVAASACRAYALVHLSGHGEHFESHGVTYGLCKTAIRGMYENNTDDATFIDSHFAACIEAAITNPGRFWSFYKCSSQGSAFGGPRMGPSFKSDGPKSLQSVIRLYDFSFWDFGNDRNPVGGNITAGTNVLEITNWAAIGTFTEDMFWKDRVCVVQGAGPGGEDLKTRVVRRISATELELRDAADTTVANGYWFVGDGGAMYQEPGYNWDVTVNGAMTWLGPSPEFELLGKGRFKIRDWWANRDHRLDIPGFAEFVRFSDDPAGGNKFAIDIDVLDAFGSSNGVAGQNSSIANWEGHNVQRIAASYVTNFERLPTRGHKNAQTLHPNQGQTPSVVAAAGVALNGGVDVWGNDETGTITIISTGAGIAAGPVLVMTFKDEWPSLFTAIAGYTQAPFRVRIDPYEHGPNDGSGASTVRAGVYAKADNADPTKITFCITEPIVGAQVICFGYDVERH